MKRYLLFAIGLALLVGIAIPKQVQAQVYGEFEPIVIRGESSPGNKIQFYDIDASNEVIRIPTSQFIIPVNQPDLDDGYAMVPIGFTFEYNGYIYSNVYVCINGFLQFAKQYQDIKNVEQNDPNGLFINSSSYAANVVAPFWGDHVYRTATDNIGKIRPTNNLFTPSSISYLQQTVNGRKRLVVQWKNLNINVDKHAAGRNDEGVTFSVATFQCILWEASDPISRQGDVEFAYGTAGADISLTDARAIYFSGASVGIKGESFDFINALIYQNNADSTGSSAYTAVKARTYTTKSGLWQPSKGTDTTIYIKALQRLNLEDSWGDGDVNLSKYPGNKHWGMPQNRFVTMNDALMIMRSVATREPLDSVRFRAAYHADANHNGRYFYDIADTVQNIVNGKWYPKKKKLDWKDMDYADNINEPGFSVPDLNQLFFEVNEEDAHYIMAYMSGRLPFLPWIHDTMPKFGKISNLSDKANGLKLGHVSTIENGLYQIPVYVNGSSNGMSTKFDFNGEVVDVTKNEIDNQQITFDYSKDRVVIVGTGNFDEQSPVCYVTVRSNAKELQLNDIRFNDNEIAAISQKISTEESVEAQVLSQTTANVITLNIKEAGNYNLSIYDVMGNKVMTLANGFYNAGVFNFDWTGYNQASGMYVCRLTSDLVNASLKLLVTK